MTKNPDHPCKGHCPGWKNGFELGSAEVDKLEKFIATHIDPHLIPPEDRGWWQLLHEKHFPENYGIEPT